MIDLAQQSKTASPTPAAAGAQPPQTDLWHAFIGYWFVLVWGF